MEIEEMYNVLDSFVPGFGKRNNKDTNNAVFIDLFKTLINMKASHMEKHESFKYFRLDLFTLERRITMRLNGIGQTIVILLLCISLVNGSHEFPITADPHSQTSPAIYGDIVIWNDTRNGNGDIYGYNLSTGEEFSIVTNPHKQWGPEIYGDIVVWVDERNGNWDIYGCNLATKEEFQITTDPENQYWPAIYEDIVIWNDMRNGPTDIYGYNLTTKEEFQITTDPESQYYSKIYEDIVVWVDERNGPTDIYGYNLTTKEEFQITADALNQHRVAIYGDIVVYEGIKSGDCNVYFHNLSNQEEFFIPADPGSFCGPATFCPEIYESIIMWRDERNDRGDIYGYNVLTSEAAAIRAPGIQRGPKIYGDVVVWTDYRNDNYDIYGCYLSEIDWIPFELPPELHSFSGRLRSVSERFYIILLVGILLIDWLIRTRRREEELPITDAEKESNKHSPERQ